MILLDEIEKAHRDVFNILLQVLDDGRLTDNHGHTVDFTNTIIVMTSNVGSQMIQEIFEGGGSSDEMEAVMRGPAGPLPAGVPQPHRREDHLPAAAAQANSPDRRVANRAAGQAIAHRQDRLGGHRSPPEAIAAQGYDPVYGARPLKRVIQQKIENPLATELLKGNVGDGIRIKVDFLDDEFTFDRIPQHESEAIEA